eukprot:TRINITY_DN6225_c0_g1_i1.p1 TRINITY_DN6225_c0_g1~~TRINITY_DN6225_c0_g1_i1.p1  ORF type:complete len:268 (-),score=35.18 TRINITY_DN6225_c0_g1_i1:6-809(-)
MAAMASMATTAMTTRLHVMRKAALSSQRTGRHVPSISFGQHVTSITSVQLPRRENRQIIRAVPMLPWSPSVWNGRQVTPGSVHRWWSSSSPSTSRSSTSSLSSSSFLSSFPTASSASSSPTVLTVPSRSYSAVDFGSKFKATEVRLKKKEKVLYVTFDNGVQFRYPAEYLRVYSPSAEVQGHDPSQRRVVANRKHVGIVELEPMGHYAVRITFDDLHESGIYSWNYLYELGVEKMPRMRKYIRELQAKGKGRDPLKRRKTPMKTVDI